MQAIYKKFFYILLINFFQINIIYFHFFYLKTVNRIQQYLTFYKGIKEAFCFLKFLNF
jgi:hypothetical protein